ncbi:unnamed protein product [Choristocarpus tenellus]
MVWGKVNSDAGSLQPGFSPGHSEQGGGMLPARMLVVSAAVMIGGIYALFQLRMLPPTIAPFVSKIYFWPTMPFTVLKAWNNYWTKMDDTLYLGCAPLGFLGHVEDLHKRGVTGVINMCSEYRGPIEEYKLFGIEQLWLPTTDHEEPELIDMQRAVSFITRHEKAGNQVLVHCKAGHGRSAAIAMAWLLTKDRDTTPQKMQKKMLAVRAVRRTLYRQPHLRLYYRSLHSSSDGGAKDKDRRSSY